MWIKKGGYCSSPYVWCLGEQKRGKRDWRRKIKLRWTNYSYLFEPGTAAADFIISIILTVTDFIIRIILVGCAQRLSIFNGKNERLDGSLIFCIVEAMICLSYSMILPVKVFCLAWSPCGKLCATVCKDGKIRVYEPRISADPIRVGVLIICCIFALYPGLVTCFTEQGWQWGRKKKEDLNYGMGCGFGNFRILFELFCLICMSSLLLFVISRVGPAGCCPASRQSVLHGKNVSVGLHANFSTKLNNDNNNDCINFFHICHAHMCID